jgi:hypothetical protein
LIAIERIEPDARHAAFIENIGPDVEFLEFRKPWKRRQTDRSHLPHEEWADREVSRAFERVDGKTVREGGLNLVRRNAPMEKEKRFPPMVHDDRPFAIRFARGQAGRQIGKPFHAGFDGAQEFR